MNYSTADVNSTDCDVGECVHILSSQTEDNNNIYSFYEAIGRIAYEIVKLDTKTKRVII